jgi:hypothetical protein
MEKLKLRKYKAILKYGKSTTPKATTYKYAEKDPNIITNVRHMKNAVLGLELLNRTF